MRTAAEGVAGSAVMSLAATLVYLSDVIQTPIGELTEANALTHELTDEQTAFGQKRKIKGHDKLRAIELLSRLTGRFLDTVNLKVDKVSSVTIGE